MSRMEEKKSIPWCHMHAICSPSSTPYPPIAFCKSTQWLRCNAVYIVWLIDWSNHHSNIAISHDPRGSAIRQACSIGRGDTRWILAFRHRWSSADPRLMKFSPPMKRCFGFHSIEDLLSWSLDGASLTVAVDRHIRMATLIAREVLLRCQ